MIGLQFFIIMTILIIRILLLFQIKKSEKNENVVTIFNILESFEFLFKLSDIEIEKFDDKNKMFAKIYNDLTLIFYVFVLFLGILVIIKSIGLSLG